VPSGTLRILLPDFCGDFFATAKKKQKKKKKKKKERERVGEREGS